MPVLKKFIFQRETVYMNDKIFIDTNLWIYAHLEESNNPKCQKAFTLLHQPKNLIISTQVLSEYYNVMLKNRQSDTWIQHNLNLMIKLCNIISVKVSTIQQTHKIRNIYGFSYWDSQIIASALESDCLLLYSEDLQHGQIIENCLTIYNPLR